MRRPVPAPSPSRRARVLAGLALALTSASVVRAQAAPTAPGAVPAGGPEWAATQRALGGRGTMQPGDVLKFSFPRTDLQVTAAGVALRPGFALGSWVAFKRTGAGADAMAMGDLVLTEDEVAPVMLALQQGGVEQTALHSHMLDESPRLLFMHFWANDDAVTLARGLRAALDRTAARPVATR